MATILLQAAGGFVGGLLGGPLGAVAGRALGGLGGYAIDSMLLGTSRKVEGARLGPSRIMEADEGAGIARLYGTARIAGQVIWTTRLEESRNTERQGGKGSAGGAEVTTYSYAGNVAVGLCEGPVAGIRRIWADGEELDLSRLTYRLHLGGEDQMPDPLIEAKQGAGNAPAYRGLAYVVFERLPLEVFGNRLPQIACEVIRPVGALEDSLRAVTIIPGASEHGLDPDPVRETLKPGEDRLLNRTVLHGPSDIEASLDELTGLCPKLERAALVVAWFGDDLRAGRCQLRPGVEVTVRKESRSWNVGGTARGGARLVSRSGGGPAYGGTPSDGGVVGAIRALKARGLKVTYYPFLLLDIPADNALADPHGSARQPAYPWRGRMTLDIATGRAGTSDGTAAAASAVAAFVGTAQASHFTIAAGKISYTGPAEWSYRRMILHQALLAKLAGGVEAFVIGSEMRGLTRIRDAAGDFPFVAALTGLAAEVKRVLPAARITYAADWSEYFGYQPLDGSGDVFFNLDPLWAHPAIDMVGIDNYLPLADWRAEDAGGAGPDGGRSAYDADALERGIAGGEYADWFYASEADRQARRRTPITDGLGKPWIYRPKDLKGWWSNRHHDRRGGVEAAQPSPWVPMSKPIWFTELGCPAIDKGANQPNVFVDPKSAESLTPFFSSGARDDFMQRRFLQAHLRHWDPAAPGFAEAANPVSAVYSGRMVDPGGVHVWTWDARPFPAFPARTDVWSDGGNWRRGHWLSGRLGKAPLDQLIRCLLADHGFRDIDVGGVDGEVGGYVLGGPGSARTELEELMRLCGIVAHSDGPRLVFQTLKSLPGGRVLDAFVDEGDGPLVEVRRMEASELPDEIVVGYLDPARSYQSAAAEAMLSSSSDPRQETVELPVVLDEADARGFAGDILSDRLGGRETAKFSISPAGIDLEAGDVVLLPGFPGRWLVSRIETGLARRVEARRLPGSFAERRDQPATAFPLPKAPVLASVPVAHFMDLPLGSASRPEDAPRIAIHARPFVPSAVEASAAGGPFERRLLQTAPATLGVLAAALLPGPEGPLDHGGRIEVELSRGALFSIDRERLLAGENLAAVACGQDAWELLQFEQAEEIAPMRFRLRTLVRAQGGTEDVMAKGAPAGAAFVLLDAATSPVGLRSGETGRVLEWRIVPVGRPTDDPAVLIRKVALGARSLMPLSPVHLRGSFAAAGALTLSWIRRTRVGGDPWDGLEVPLGEEIERYAVTFGDGTGREARFETAVPMFVFPPAEQTAAFGSIPARLTAGVAQIGLGVGPGVERQAAFQRPV